MFICLCKGITDSQIQQAVTEGATTLAAVRRKLELATQCCKCLPEARMIIDVTIAKQQETKDALTEPLFHSA